MKKRNSKIIKKLAKKIGFSSCGISKARFLKEEEKNFEDWLKQGKQGKMGYLERNFDKRLNPKKLVPGAKSVISLTFNYFPPKKISNNNSFIISKYAYGKDYHYIIKEKLNALFSKIKEKIGNVEGRVFVDSAPIHERAWAKISGLGWIGKNSLLINKNMGSYFFLAEIVCDLDLEYDSIVSDHCGTCSKCIDACPTNAITEAQVIDSNRCISYLTIENKGDIPKELSQSFNDYIFGCDICQDVCPWNRFSKPHSEKELMPKEKLKKMSKKDWKELTKETFDIIFKDSAIKRCKFDGLKRNILSVS
ncbi:MAG: tRNA epoxyqueuosine(34) reductase QueG [Cytophagia bacterium]|jgi:epoxyqueuosine reductase|nr:tRNA epoxyqueuosine(34) reductase QueG [Cytophagia bacterium]|tara:strand:+ start:840 stop:1757 length:918 start_codon:yes stop_codon:yes gene_type:complete